MKHLLLLPFCLVCIGPGISPVVAAAPAVVPAQRYQLSTHILDVGRGRPAAGVLLLYRLSKQEDAWEKVGEGVTDRNGRIGNFLPQSQSNDGIYKLRFETKEYFRKQKQESIYPFVEVVFEIRGSGHYHIPITMSANGYGTYRGN